MAKTQKVKVRIEADGAGGGRGFDVGLDAAPVHHLYQQRQKHRIALGLGNQATDA